MKLEPMHDWILLELDEVGTTAGGNLHLPPDSSVTKQQMKKATVLAVGPGKVSDREPPDMSHLKMPDGSSISLLPRVTIDDLQEGDRVLLKPNPGALCPEGLPRDDQRRFVQYGSIVAKLSEEGNGSGKVAEA